MNQSTDRNLLFGILALNMDFISREALIGAMHAWLAEKSKSIGQLLVERGDLDSARRDLLEPLVDAHVEQHGGDPQQSLAALSSGVGLAEELCNVDDQQVQAK